MDVKGRSAFAADAGVGFPLIRRRVYEISKAVIARANDVANEAMRPGLDQAARFRFAEMVTQRTAQCAITVQQARKVVSLQRRGEAELAKSFGFGRKREARVKTPVDGNLIVSERPRRF